MPEGGNSRKITIYYSEFFLLKKIFLKTGFMFKHTSRCTFHAGFLYMEKIGIQRRLGNVIIEHLKSRILFYERLQTIVRQMSP